MQAADRKLAWSAVFVMAVVAVELAWIIFVGPANHSPSYAATCEKNCDLPWWDSVAAWTMIFTGLLTGSTILLWVSTRSAAMIAGRALSEHERPWIFRDLVTVRWRHRPGITMNDWDVSLKWKNVGRAPATLIDFVFKIQDVETLSKIPDYTACDHLPVIDAMPPNGPVEYDTTFVGLSHPGIKPNGDPIQYVFWGRLRYREMNGTEHISGYALQLIPFAAGAASHNSDAYNYYT